jgi:hypothetical protein
LLPSALAWGKKGHDGTSEIADKYLDEKARAVIYELRTSEQRA